MTTRKPITRGGGGHLSTIYERLRKRSYRKMEKVGWWWTGEHQCYLDGVLDALQAIDERR